MTATAQRTLTLSCVILTMGNRPAEVIRAIDSVLAQHGAPVDLVIRRNHVNNLIDYINADPTLTGTSAGPVTPCVVCCWTYCTNCGALSVVSATGT